MRFKVGDRVKILNATFITEETRNKLIGREGIITPSNNSAYPYVVGGFLDENLNGFGFEESELELVSNTPEVEGVCKVDGETLGERVDKTIMRTFDTGATRHTDISKLDFEGFLSPLVLERYAQYLNKHRTQADGKTRDSDNWQRGIPKDVYIKSKFRHFIDWWTQHREIKNGNLVITEEFEDSICADLFNTMGYLHELLREKKNEPD